jgi:hypothetical protein
VAGAVRAGDAPAVGEFNAQIIPNYVRIGWNNFWNNDE